MRLAWIVVEHILYPKDVRAVVMCHTTVLHRRGGTGSQCKGAMEKSEVNTSKNIVRNTGTTAAQSLNAPQSVQ
eukprot:1974853-Amphidinium_carterae.2